MPFLPVFNFISAEHFIQMRRVTYQRRLTHGGILTKVDETQVHSRILRNTFTCLNFQLLNSSECLYVLNLQFKFNDFDLIAEPDLAITAPRETFPIWPPAIPINPVIIIEVLFPDNEREQKFKQYRQFASLREYLRIETDRYLLEHLVQQPDQEWKSVQIKNWEEKVSLTSIDANLSLAAVYEQVKIENK